VRTTQKARSTPTEGEVALANAFKPFTGTAKRIDGKIAASAREAKLARTDTECKEGGTDGKEEGKNNGGGGYSRGGSSGGGGAGSSGSGSGSNGNNGGAGNAGSAAMARMEAQAKVSASAFASSSTAPAAGPVYKSTIGEKYSKKKAAVSAFTGTAHKLN
jgi:hypothetical protein